VHFSEPSLQHATPSNEGQRSHKHGEQYHGNICSDAQCTSAPLLRVATCRTGTCVAAHGPQRTEGLAGQLLRIISLATLALLGGWALGMAGERGGMIMGGRGGWVQKGTRATKREVRAVAVDVFAAGGMVVGMRAE